jgi:hypothetical protein
MNIIVIKVETKTIPKDFTTLEAAQKWVESRPDHDNPQVEYQIWDSTAPIAR